MNWDWLPLIALLLAVFTILALYLAAAHVRKTKERHEGEHEDRAHVWVARRGGGSMSDDVVYFSEETQQPIGVRIGGRMLPVEGGSDVTVTAGDLAITRVVVSLLTPGLKFVFVASGEGEALQSEVSDARGGAK